MSFKELNKPHKVSPASLTAGQTRGKGGRGKLGEPDLGQPSHPRSVVALATSVFTLLLHAWSRRTKFCSSKDCGHGDQFWPAGLLSGRTRQLLLLHRQVGPPGRHRCLSPPRLAQPQPPDQRSQADPETREGGLPAVGSEQHQEPRVPRSSSAAGSSLSFGGGGNCRKLDLGPRSAQKCNILKLPTSYRCRPSLLPPQRWERKGYRKTPLNVEYISSKSV